MDFTVEEINFICIALDKTKGKTIKNIYGMLPDITDEEMKEIAERVLSKLEKISDDEFDEMRFDKAFEE